MKKQKVPRKMIGDGLDLDIYRRCGWEPPKTKDEKKEMNKNKEYAEYNMN